MCLIDSKNKVEINIVWDFSIFDRNIIHSELKQDKRISYIFHSVWFIRVQQTLVLWALMHPCRRFWRYWILIGKTPTCVGNYTSKFWIKIWHQNFDAKFWRFFWACTGTFKGLDRNRTQPVYMTPSVFWN